MLNNSISKKVNGCLIMKEFVFVHLLNNFDGGIMVALFLFHSIVSAHHEPPASTLILLLPVGRGFKRLCNWGLT